MTINLVNETCYTTEDLVALATKCDEAMKACQEAHAATQGAHYINRQRPPKTIRVGYYQPRRTKNYGLQYVNMSGYGEDRRLGIVKSSKLGVIPLLALAQAADGADCAMPQAAVDELVYTLAALSGGTWNYLPTPNAQRWNNNDSTKTYESYWEWTKGFQVRYQARAKRGSKAAVKKAREKGKLERLKNSLESKKNNVEYQKIKLSQAKYALAHAEEQIETLTERLKDRKLAVKKTEAEIETLSKKVAT
jgi:hypothetical protein